MNRAHLLNPPDEATEPCEAQPEGFDTGLAVAFAGKETTQHGDAADHFAQGWRFSGGWFFGQQPGSLPFGLLEHGTGGQLGKDATQPRQVGQPPGDDQIDGQRQLQFKSQSVVGNQGTDHSITLGPLHLPVMRQSDTQHRPL